MLKLILAPELCRFFLKMNFIYKVMGKTSVINMSTGGVPSGKLSIVLLKNALSIQRMLLAYWESSSNALLLYPLYSCQLQLGDCSLDWCLDYAGTVSRQGWGSWIGISMLQG